jgi:hypothetical protein
MKAYLFFYLFLLFLTGMPAGSGCIVDICTESVLLEPFGLIGNARIEIS